MLTAVADEVVVDLSEEERKKLPAVFRWHQMAEKKENETDTVDDAGRQEATKKVLFHD